MSDEHGIPYIKGFASQLLFSNLYIKAFLHLERYPYSYLVEFAENNYQMSAEPPQPDGAKADRVIYSEPTLPEHRKGSVRAGSHESSLKHKR